MLFEIEVALRCYDVLGLWAFGTLSHLERDCLTDLQAVILTAASAVVEEHVVGALDGNETEPFVGLGLNSS